MNEQAKIFEGLQKLAILMGGNVSQERLIGYVNYLSEYSYEEVQNALNKIVLTCDRFPTIKQIRSILEPELNGDQNAIDLAGTIISCISSIGGNNHEQAKKEIGEIGWQAVESYGGWRELCKISNNEIGTANAQLRELCKVKLQRKKIERTYALKAQRISKDNDTKHLGDILKITN